jgi:hypothetical protein
MKDEQKLINFKQIVIKPWISYVFLVDFDLFLDHLSTRMHQRLQRLKNKNEYQDTRISR